MNLSREVHLFVFLLVISTENRYNRYNMNSLGVVFMKKFRPSAAGFYVLYGLFLLCAADVVHLLIGGRLGTLNETAQSFSMFSYLLVIVAFFYVKLYGATRVEITDKTFHMVYPVYIKPAPDAKRVNFLFRSGENDMKQLDKTFPFVELEKFGFIEDLGYSLLDRSGAGEHNALFPVHEVAFVMKDGRRYHWNAAFYGWKAQKEIVTLVQNASGVTATGKLADAVNYTEEIVKQMKAEYKAAKKAEKNNAGKGKKKK